MLALTSSHVQWRQVLECLDPKSIATTACSCSIVRNQCISAKGLLIVPDLATDVRGWHPTVLTVVDPAEVHKFRIVSRPELGPNSAHAELHLCAGWLLGALPVAHCKLESLAVCSGCEDGDGILSEHTIRALFTWLSQRCSRLKELVFKDGPYREGRLWILDDSLCTRLGRALLHMNHIQVLRLSMNVRSKQGYVSIFEGIASCRSLRALELHDFDDGVWTLEEPIGDSAFPALQRMLDQLSLEHMTFSTNVLLNSVRPWGSSTTSVSEIQWPQSLRILRIRIPSSGTGLMWEDADAAAYCALAERVRLSPRITALSMNWGSHGVSCQGFDAFLRILAGSQLASLELWWLAADDDAWETIHPSVCLSLRDFVHNSASLQELGVGHFFPGASAVTPEWRLLKDVAAVRGVRIARRAPATHWHGLRVNDD